MTGKELSLEEFEKKIDRLKQGEKLDLSSDQDLSIAVMNLVSLEEHFFFTASKTNKPKYFDLLGEVREIRKSLLKKLVKNPEGEIWCISKHLLAASMRLMEVGTKQQGMGHKEEAKEMFAKAYQLYSLFWGVNMNLIDAADVKSIDEDAISKSDKEKSGFMGKLGSLVRRAIDCCIE